ncbi:MAG: aldehyde dehydrogenase family protein [Deltaproteobacteria bacterium]|nr:aldehyde dehydrogenase family protein [Deltaproteobacteria bacterium]
MLKVINPFNGLIYTEIPFDTSSTLQKKIEGARKTFQKWSDLSLDERIEIIKEGISYFETNRDQIASDITGQMGKPISESYGEIKGFFQRANQMLSIAKEALEPDILPEKPGFHRRIEHIPHGVVLDIAAWNYPLLIAVNVVIPALLSGNCVLLKHSAKTPLCGLHFEKAFNGVFDGLVHNLILSHEQTSELVGNPAIDHVVFTGSLKGGLAINGAASRRLIEVGLELGGKDPAYVMDDADLDFTVSNIVEGACYNSGQSCCSIERVYVHESLYDSFLKRAVDLLKKIRLGDPMEESTSMGPMVTPAAGEFLESQVKEAVIDGAELIIGGGRHPDFPGNYFMPTLLKNVPNQARIMQEESFGPVIPTASVRSDREALELMNDSKYGLTASVWTKDRTRAEWMAKRLKAGTIYQNRCDYLDPAQPWTGVKDSGKGSSLSRYGFWHLTKRKSIHFRNPTT